MKHRRSYIVELLQADAQVAVVDGVIFGRVVDVWHLADVKELLLLVVERLEQLAPAIEEQQQPAGEVHPQSARIGRKGWQMCHSSFSDSNMAQTV